MLRVGAFLVVQALVLGYGLSASLRARFAPGLTAIAAIALFTLLLPVLALSGNAGPLASWCAAYPFVPPLVAAAIAGYASRRAFQLHDAEREAVLPGEGEHDWDSVKDYFLTNVGSLLVPPGPRLEIQSQVVDVRPPK